MPPSAPARPAKTLAPAGSTPARPAVPAAAPGASATLSALRAAVPLPDRIRDSIGKHRERLTKYEVFSHEFDKLPVTATWQRLARELSLDEKRADVDALEQAYDKAPDNYKTASFLAGGARSELESFRLMRSAAAWYFQKAARSALALLKKDLGGQITEALIESWMMANLPEYRALAEEEENLRRTTHALEAFAKAWERRSFAIGLQYKVALHRRGVPLEALAGSEKTKAKTPDDAE